MKGKLHGDLSSSTLHLLAMGFMLCDHLWATVVTGNQWLTCLGRLAYPIFAFLLVEGYFHTSNLRRYGLRLLLFALMSELPFNLMYNGSLFYPLHQNVMWTLLLGLGCIHLNEWARKKDKLFLRILLGIGTVLGGFLLGFVTMVDYYGVGVLTILVFYFFRGGKWWCYLGQFALLYYLNVEVLSGMSFVVHLFGREVWIVKQGLALLALLPIWLYRGRKGLKGKGFQYLCYAFYPAHMLLLWLLKVILYH